MLIPSDMLTETLATWLLEHRGSISDAAEAIGVAPRTLQHHLTKTGSSFRLVVDAGRMRRAQDLLANTDDKITAIACEVGFSSLQHFSSWFKRRTGLRPAEYRHAAHRSSFAIAAAA